MQLTCSPFSFPIHTTTPPPGTGGTERICLEDSANAGVHSAPAAVHRDEGKVTEKGKLHTEHTVALEDDTGSVRGGFRYEKVRTTLLALSFTTVY